MPNNLNARNIKYVKLMKWTLNRINYKTLYANLHYFNDTVGQCERHLSNSISFCKYYHCYSGTIKHIDGLELLIFIAQTTTGQQISLYINYAS